VCGQTERPLAIETGGAPHSRQDGNTGVHITTRSGRRRATDPHQGPAIHNTSPPTHARVFARFTTGGGANNGATSSSGTTRGHSTTTNRADRWLATTPTSATCPRRHVDGARRTHIAPVLVLRCLPTVSSSPDRASSDLSSGASWRASPARHPELAGASGSRRGRAAHGHSRWRARHSPRQGGQGGGQCGVHTWAGSRWDWRR
jgi:hypothetical protein